MKTVRRYVSLLAAVQLLAACSDADAPAPIRPDSTASPKAAASAPQADERLILALGDSLYAGYGLAQDESFPAVLERRLDAGGVPARIVNAGVSGDTTAGGRGRLAFTLDGLERKPDLAIVGLGANDALRGLDPAQTRANLDAILAELQRREIPVMLTGMVAPRNLGGAYFASFDSIYPDLARKYDAPLYPFFLDGVITRPDLLLSDGIHPNAKGIEVMVRGVLPLVTEALETDPPAARAAAS